MVEAGPEATRAVQAVQMRGVGIGLGIPMAPFEGSRSALVSPVLQEEAKRMLMQLMPVVVEATEQGMTVTLMVGGQSKEGLHDGHVDEQHKSSPDRVLSPPSPLSPT